MTEDLSGGWLTPERKKAIVVSLYIWVPLTLISAIMWKYYYHALPSTLFVLQMVPGALVIFAVLLLLRQKQMIFSCVISFLWNFIFNWFIFAIDLFRSPIVPSGSFIVPFIVPPFICYVYNKKGVVKIGLGGYILSAIFPILAFFSAVIAAYILPY